MVSECDITKSQLFEAFLFLQYTLSYQWCLVRGFFADDDWIEKKWNGIA